MQCSVPPRLTSCELSMNSSGPTIDYSGAGKRERSAGDDRGEAFQPNSKRSLYGHSFRRAPRALLDVVPSKTSPRSFHLGAAETVRRACIVFAAPMLSRGPRLTRRLILPKWAPNRKRIPLADMSTGITGGGRKTTPVVRAIEHSVRRTWHKNTTLPSRSSKSGDGLLGPGRGAVYRPDRSLPGSSFGSLGPKGNIRPVLRRSLSLQPRSGV